MSTLIQPEDVAARAWQILDTWQADGEWARLRSSCAKYSSDWTDCYGYTIIPDYDAVVDAPALFGEAVRVLALKSAVYELTGGDEKAAELAQPVPTDVMSHALTAQFTVLSRIQERTGIRFVHATDMEDGFAGGTWQFGDFTHRAYRAAWGPVHERYWIDADTTECSRRVLDEVYAGIGITERGKKAAIVAAAAA
ncbi:hypothetical protein ACJ6WD_36610 [Streptomyces sp. VTCC 41912]|uniref:hypothetical protein n=1 Tax=Streptomyces TaxID=1883 RepID=UPI002F26D30E